MTNRSGRKGGGYFVVPNRWIDAGYMAACPGSVTQVYLHLNRWADNESDEAAQPVALIARMCGLTEKSTRRALRFLEGWGVITLLDERNDRNHNVWLLNDLPKKCPPTPEESSTPEQTTPAKSSGVQKVTGQKVTPLYQPDPNQPDGSNQPEGTNAHTNDEDFESWWTVYPRKVKKADARKAFKKINPDPETLARMIADVQARSRSRDWNEEGGKFIPHPTTYLNQRRWEDEDDPAPSVTPLPGQHLSQDDLRKLPMSAWKYGVYEFGSAGAAVFRKDWEAGTLPQLDGSRP